MAPVPHTKSCVTENATTHQPHEHHREGKRLQHEAGGCGSSPSPPRHEMNGDNYDTNDTKQCSACLPAESESWYCNGTTFPPCNRPVQVRTSSELRHRETLRSVQAVAQHPLNTGAQECAASGCQRRCWHESSNTGGVSHGGSSLIVVARMCSTNVHTRTLLGSRVTHSRRINNKRVPACGSS